MLNRGHISLAGAFLSMALIGQFMTGSPAAAALTGSVISLAGNGTQQGEWSKSQNRVRLVATANGSMSSSRCIDSTLDWKTSNGLHYDGRTVRSCLPGGSITTNPGGSGYWNESFGDRIITDMRRGGGAEISDTYTGGNFAMYAYQGYPGTLGDPYSSRPRTCTDKWARTRTLYNNGQINTCEDNSNPLDPNG